MKKSKWIFVIVALCMVAVFVFAGCDNAAGGSKPTGKDDGNPPPVSDDPRNAVIGTYNNVEIDGEKYNFEFYEGSVGLVKKSVSGNIRAIMPDVPAEGSYFMWSLSGDTVIITFTEGNYNSFTLDFSNSGGTKKLSNLRPVPAATYEWDEATKTLTFKGPGEIKSTGKKNADVEKIIIQDGVTILGIFAFYLYENLKSVTIPDSVVVIGTSAFIGCRSLTSVTLPDSTDVFAGAFNHCEKLTNIIVGSRNIYYTSENGVLYNKDKTKIIAWPAASGTVSIPSSITNIGAGAFHACYSLTSVTIPSGVTDIGYAAFMNCPLESVTVKATTPPKLGTSVIPDGELVFPDDTKIYVPSASVNAYKTAAGWSEYASVIEPI